MANQKFFEEFNWGNDHIGIMLKNNYTKKYIEQGLSYVTYRNVGTKNYCSIRNLSLGYKEIFSLHISKFFQVFKK